MRTQQLQICVGLLAQVRNHELRLRLLPLQLPSLSLTARQFSTELLQLILQLLLLKLQILHSSLQELRVYLGLVQSPLKQSDIHVAAHKQGRTG